MRLFFWHLKKNKFLINLMKKGINRDGLWCLLCIACFIGGYYFQDKSLHYIKNMRQMERVPKVSANHVVPGEVNIEGKAQKNHEIIRSKYTKTECLYYAYLKEREKTGSDGDKYWVTVEKGFQSTDFRIQDSTGSVLVELTKGGVKPELNRDYYITKGSIRYSEWRIQEGEFIHLFAMAMKYGGQNIIRFDQKGSFVPSLSNDVGISIRTSWGTKGVLFNVLGISLYCFGCLFLCFSLRIHRVLLFLSATSALIFMVLVFCSLRMMKDDLSDGHQRLVRLQQSSTNAVSEIFDGFEEGWDFDSKELMSLDEKTRGRVLGIRDDFLSSISRSNQILQRFPERLLRPLWGLELWEVPPGIKIKSDAEIKKTPIPISIFIISIKPAIGLIVFGLYFGFRKIKTKRYIENIPTSSSIGLSYGPAELAGKLALDSEAKLIGPESKKPCAYYRHKVTEVRRSGDRRTTITIKDESKMVPFFCTDKDGKTKVVPDGSEIIAGLKKKRQIGNRTYLEWHLAEGEEVYILGSAEIDEVAGDKLLVCDGKEKFPFIISDRSEEATMLHHGRKGLFGLGLALNASVFVGMVIFGTLGSFAPTDFLLSAIVAPIFLSICMFVLMYNDLVFLRNRVRRAWSNIEVSLQKRADLIPNLEQVVKNYMSHEKEVLEYITEIRTSIAEKKSFSTTEADSVMEREILISERLFALREDNPNLKGNEMMEDLMNRLVRMENEVSMMRTGYNDGVERYRTTIQRMPEVILARIFKFNDVASLKFSCQIRDIPQLN